MQKIWIELERDADSTVNDHRANLANKLLRKAGATYDHYWWNERTSSYCVNIDSGGSFLECDDDGHWFNLDFLAR